MNSWKNDDEQNISYFTSLAEKYGTSFRAVDWGSKESQELRFSILAEVGNLENSNVLDVGCGTGDFYGWLKQNGIETNYTGIDITPKMIEAAKWRFPKRCFEVKNLLNQDDDVDDYDYVFASGIFCYRENEPFEYLKEMVSKMFLICTNAVAFNSLSLWALEKEKNEFYADPSATLDFCRKLTQRFVLRHDYHSRDFTIYLYK